MAEERKKGYHEGAPWKGHPRYECDECPFDSLHEDVVAKHVANRHGPTHAERLAMLQAYDAHGRPKKVTVAEEPSSGETE
jgi:hypothetical protein